MTKNTNRRLDDLERKTGGGDESVIVVTWSDNGKPDPSQIVTVKGEKMTYAEYGRRYPNNKIITLDWGDDDEIIRTT